MQATLTFNRTVTNLALYRFQVVNSSGTVQEIRVDKWKFDPLPGSNTNVVPYTVTEGSGILISVKPGIGITGSFKIRLQANAAFGPNATYLNIPTATVDSAAVTIS